MKHIKDRIDTYMFEDIIIPIKKVNYKIDQSLNIDELPSDVRDFYIGAVKGRVDFYDGSKLDFNELIEFKYDKTIPGIIMDRNNYKYNYFDPNNRIKLAYHSGPHEKVYKNLKSYPHHKHIGPHRKDFCEGNEDIRLKTMMNEIEKIIATQL